MNKCCDDNIFEIYKYLEPQYVCILKPYTLNNGAAGLACSSKYHNNLRCSKQTKCIIVTNKYKKMCSIHCKAYPIYKIVYNRSIHSINNNDDYVHFPSKYVARFAPSLIHDHE